MTIQAATSFGAFEQKMNISAPRTTKLWKRWQKRKSPSCCIELNRMNFRPIFAKIAQRKKIQCRCSNQGSRGWTGRRGSVSKSGSIDGIVEMGRRTEFIKLFQQKEEMQRNAIKVFFEAATRLLEIGKISRLSLLPLSSWLSLSSSSLSTLLSLSSLQSHETLKALKKKN